MLRTPLAILLFSIASVVLGQRYMGASDNGDFIARSTPWAGVELFDTVRLEARAISAIGGYGPMAIDGTGSLLLLHNLEDQQVQLWSLDDDSLLGVVSHNVSGVESPRLAFAPVSPWLVVAGRNTLLLVDRHDLEDRRGLNTAPCGSVHGLSVSNDGLYLALASVDQTCVLNLQSGAVSRFPQPSGFTFNHIGGTHRLAFDPTGERLAVAGLYGQLVVIDTGTGTVLLRATPGGRGDLSGLFWASEGNVLIASDGVSVHLLDPETGQTLRSHAAPDHVYVFVRRDQSIVFRTGEPMQIRADLDAIRQEREFARHIATNPDLAFEIAASGGAAPVSRLLASGVDLNTPDATGKTLLMHAANSNTYNAVVALLEAGASVTSVDESGRTALHFAATREDDLWIPMAIVQAGANPYLADLSGVSALELMPESLANDVRAATNHRPPSGDIRQPAEDGSQVRSRPSGIPTSPAGQAISASGLEVVNFIANELELSDLPCSVPAVDHAICGRSADSDHVVMQLTDVLFAAYLQPSDLESGWRRANDGTWVAAFRRPEGLYVLSIANSVVAIGFLEH